MSRKKIVNLRNILKIAVITNLGFYDDFSERMKPKVDLEIELGPYTLRLKTKKIKKHGKYSKDWTFQNVCRQ